MSIAHIAVLWAWALVFSFAPAFASQLPLSAQLSSDAEWYAVALMRVSDPPLIANDDVFALDLLPAPERHVLAFFANMADALHLDILDWSVALSLVALALYVAGLYLLLRWSLSPAIAFSLAAVLVVPVHALGGTTLGFEARGFLPRDLALALAMFVLIGYVRAGGNGRGLAAIFVLCGGLANGYSMLYAHLAVVLLGAELLRDRRLGIRHFAFGLCFVAGALPTVVDILTSDRRFAPPDAEILVIREGSLLLQGPISAIIQALRRLIIYAAVVGLVLAFGWRALAPELRGRLGPWIPVLASSGTISIAGLILENATPYTRYLPSRASVFFFLAASIVIAASLPALGAAMRGPRGRALGVATAFAIFVAQSNVPTVYRELVDAVRLAPERADFMTVARSLRESTTAATVLSATADEVPDLAASLRTYARRPVYVSFKDVGIVLYDGARGRMFYERWRESQAALGSGAIDQIRAFLLAHGITAAVVPIRVLEGDISSVQRIGAFVIIRR